MTPLIALWHKSNTRTGIIVFGDIKACEKLVPSLDNVHHRCRLAFILIHTVFLKANSLLQRLDSYWFWKNPRKTGNGAAVRVRESYPLSMTDYGRIAFKLIMAVSILKGTTSL